MMLRRSTSTTLNATRGVRRSFATDKRKNGLPNKGPPSSTPPPPSATAKPNTSSGSTGFLVLAWTAIPASVYFYSKFNPEWAPPGLGDKAIWKLLHESIHGKKESKDVAAAAVPKPVTKQQPVVVVTQPAVVKKAVEKNPQEKPVENKKKEEKPKKEQVAVVVSEQKPPVAKKKSTPPSPPVVVTEEKPQSSVKVEKKKAEVLAPKDDLKVEKKDEVLVNKEAKQPEVTPPTLAATTVNIPKDVEAPKITPKKSLERLSDELQALEKKAKEYSSATKQRLSEQTQTEIRALQEDIEKSMLSGLESLDSAALRIRVVQLVSEIKNRTKWEAMRLLDALKTIEQETNAKNLEVLKNQEQLHQEVLERQLENKEAEVLRKAKTVMEKERKRYMAEVEKIAQDIHTDVSKKYEDLYQEKVKAMEGDMQARLATEVSALQAAEDDERVKRLQNIDDLRLQLKSLHSVLDSRSVYEAFSHQVHKVSVAALALSDRIEANKPLHDELNALRNAGRGDDMIEAVLNSLPTSLSNQGVPSLAQLETRFKEVQKVGRQAALTPKDSGIIGHISGTIMAALTLSPKGLVDGTDTEALLSRASHFLQDGDLSSAVGEVEKLSGYPAEIASDWLKDAESRLLVEQALKVTKAHVSLLAESCS